MISYPSLSTGESIHSPFEELHNFIHFLNLVEEIKLVNDNSQAKSQTRKQ